MHLLGDIVDLLLARACVGCTLPGPLLCELCASSLMPDAFIVPGMPMGLPPVAAGQPYAGTAKGVVVAHKEHHARSLTPMIGMLLAAAVRRLDAADAIVPVPSHPRSLRARGRDTVMELARDAGTRVGMPVIPLLARGAGGRQKQRTARQRRLAPLMAPVTLQRQPTVRRAILVDDVIATGSTVRQCHEVLTMAGVTVVGIACATAALLEQAGRASRDQLG